MLRFGSMSTRFGWTVLLCCACQAGHGSQVSHGNAVSCNPPPIPLCSAPQEPTTTPASCVPRRLRGALLLDERALGIADGWRVYQSCPVYEGQSVANARQRGYLFEHAGTVAATPQQQYAVLEQHRAALHVVPTFGTGLSAAGPTATIEGDVRIEKVLPDLKRNFADVPSELCFAIQINTWSTPPVPL
jgi:hypothetical protein